MWNSSSDRDAAFYFAQIPSLFVLSGSVGFQECPWQADGCEPPGLSLIKVNPDIDLGPTGQLSVASAWHSNAEEPPLRFDIGVANGAWFDSRPNIGRTIRSNYSHLPPELEPYVVSPVYKTAPPTSGAWVAGQKVWATPAAANATAWQPNLLNDVVAWVCVRSGTPGTWKAVRAQ